MAKKSSFLGIEVEDWPYIAVVFVGGWVVVSLLSLQVEVSVLRNELEELKST